VNPSVDPPEHQDEDSSSKSKNAEPEPTSGSEDKALLGSAAGGLGTAIAAVFAALCCIGPSTVAVLGAGGALAAASLSPYRPYLLIASLAMILYGFWRTYRTTVVNREGAACPTRIGRFTRKVLWFAAIVWVAAAVLFRG
jgi:hypothetical protein